jgi:hypothetical protein
MPPNGEIAIPVYKNIPQALGVNCFEIGRFYQTALFGLIGRLIGFGVGFV